MARSLLASSINGRFSASDNNFHSAPSLLLISELCIFGFSWAIFRLWPRDHTMKAFIGRFTLSASFLLAPEFGDPAPLPLRLVWGFGECCWGWPWEWEPCIPACWGLTGTCIPWEDGGSCVCPGFGKSCSGRSWYSMRVLHNLHTACVLSEWKWIKFKSNWDDKMINLLVLSLSFNNTSWIPRYFFFIWLIWFTEHEISIRPRTNTRLVVQSDCRMLIHHEKFDVNCVGARKVWT